MQFDNGEVLQGLDEDWTFLGANLMEWISGFVVFIMISLFGATPARAMPFMIAGWLITTISLANLRKVFPDQQRGVRNALLTSCGFRPTDIPSPARLQPVWSQCPIRDLPEESKFKKLGLDEVFPSFSKQLQEADEDN